MFTTFFTAIGLSMDAVAVSISSGLSVRNLRFSDALKMALFFGVFQAIMPLLGYLAGLLFKAPLQAYDHWIAFVLLGFLGVNMVRQSHNTAEEEVHSPFRNNKLLVLSIATSIDALAVGVSFSLLDMSLIETVSIIGVVTFALCLPAVWFGAMLGKRIAKYAELLGGLILIAIGCGILFEHLKNGI